MILETIHSGRDNTFTLTFTDNNQPLDFSAVTKVEFILVGVTVDSINNPQAFDYSTNGQIIFSLGQFYTSAHSGDAEIIIYSPAYPNGLVLAHPSGYPQQVRVIIK